MYRRILTLATVAVLTLSAAGAMAATARSGSYKGRNQFGAVAFKVAAGKVSGFRYQSRPTCRALGQTLPDSGAAPSNTIASIPLAGARFSVHHVEQDAANGATTTTDVVGTISGGRVTGYTQDKVTASTQGVDVVCSTPRVPFSASRG